MAIDKRTGELLDYFHDLTIHAPWHGTTKEERMIDEIRRRIEAKPRVSREFVKTWEKEFAEEAKVMYVYKCTAGRGFGFYIANMLRDAGVEVK